MAKCNQLTSLSFKGLKNSRPNQRTHDNYEISPSSSVELFYGATPASSLKPCLPLPSGRTAEAARRWGRVCSAQCAKTVVTCEIKLFQRHWTCSKIFMSCNKLLNEFWNNFIWHVTTALFSARFSAWPEEEVAWPISMKFPRQDRSGWL